MSCVETAHNSIKRTILRESLQLPKVGVRISFDGMFQAICLPGHHQFYIIRTHKCTLVATLRVRWRSNIDHYPGLSPGIKGDSAVMC